MFCVSIEISFCYGHRLQEYDGVCRHLHGHNGRAILTMASETLDDQGMVHDFRSAKDAVKGWLDGAFDHTLILQDSDPILPVLREAGEKVTEIDCPPTAENIARLIYEQAERCGLPMVEVALWETERCSATYRGSPPA
jgi:6-pyruvoyltetrahydropterin/6-carboxytetrahydropterin synthase